MKIFRLIIVLTLTAGCVSSDSTDDRSEQIEAYIMSQEFVTDRLQSPGTADFPWFDSAMIERTSESEFEITSYVDSQNLFGGVIRTDYHAVLRRHDDPRRWELVDLKIR